MSATLEKRRATSLWSALVSDPYRKLAAIGLACALYYFLDNQVNSAHTFEKLPLVTLDEAAPPSASKFREEVLQVVVPKSKVTVIGFRDAGNDTPLSHVSLVISGAKSKVKAAIDHKRPFIVGPFEGIDWDRTSRFDFTAADIKPDITLEGLDLALIPPRVSIDLEQNDVSQVALTLDKIQLNFQNSTDADRIRKETVKFSTESVRIRGPKSKVEALGRDRATLFRTTLVALDESRVSGTIELITDNNVGSEVTMDPGVTVTVRLEPVPTTFTLDIPLLIDDRSLPPRLRGLYWPDLETRQGEPPPIQDRPDLYQSMKVSVKVSGRLKYQLEGYDPQDLARFSAQHMRLRAWIPPLPTDGSKEEARIPVEAKLDLLGPQFSLIESIDCRLENTVVITLVLHKPPPTK